MPPTTWDEFIEAAKAVKAKTGAAGFCMFTQHNQGGWTFMNWGWQAGGEFERQEGDQWQAVFDEQPIVEAMQLIKDLRWQHNVLQDELLFDVGQSFPMVASHQCGMVMFTPDWFEIVVNEHGGNLDDLGLTILPAGPAGHANVMGGGYTVINVNASPEVQQAAFEWITWRMFSLEALENEIKSQGGFARWSISTRSLMYKPSSGTAQREQELVEKYRNVPYFKTYVEEAGKYARPEPPIATQELYAALDGVIQTVLTDENADPQTLLTEAVRQFQAEYLDTLWE